jgi:hypothetical protein
MSKRHGSYIDAKPPVRIILSTLWTSMLFVFAYVDIFGFWRADVIRGALAKKVPGSGFVIDQRFLLLTTIYILIPALMIAATMLMPARITRMVNIGVSAVYLVSVLAFTIGESWAYYLVGSAVECLLLLVIAVVAWRWPREATTTGAGLDGRDASEPATRGNIRSATTV